MGEMDAEADRVTRNRLDMFQIFHYVCLSVCLIETGS